MHCWINTPRNHSQPLLNSAVIKAAEANARAGTGRKAFELYRGQAPLLRRWRFFRRGTPAIGDQVPVRLKNGLPGTELRLKQGCEVGHRLFRSFGGCAFTTLSEKVCAFTIN